MSASHRPPETPTSALITVMRLDGKGGASQLAEDDIRHAWQHDESSLWLHLDFGQPNIGYFLDDIAQLEPAVKEALIEEYVRPRVARFPGGLMTTLRGVDLRPGATPDKLISLRIWLTPNRLITLRRRQLPVIKTICDDLAKGHGPASLTEVVTQTADMMVDQLGSLLEEMNQVLGRYEEGILDNEDITTNQLAHLRRPMRTLTRFIQPQADCLNRLGESSMGMNERHRIAFREIANHLSRYLEDLKAMQDRTMMLQEQMSSLHSERLNSRMYMMSLITTLFLPLTFLTGLLGVNVGGVPGVNNHFAFWWVVIISAVSMAVAFGALSAIKLYNRRRWRRENR